MFKAIERLITGRKDISKADVQNLLNQIVYTYAANNSGVVWFDATQKEKYIREGYMGNASVYSIVRRISDKAKIAPVQVFTRDEKSRNLYQRYKYQSDPLQRVKSLAYRSKEIHEVLDNSNLLYKLLYKPNPQQSWPELMDAASIFYRSTGEAFIYRVAPTDGKYKGIATELYVLPSHLVEIVTGTWEEPIKAYRLRLGQTLKEIPAEDVLHIKMPNPDWNLSGQQLRGLPPLMAAANILTTNRSAIEALTKAIQNEGAKGLLTPDASGNIGAVVDALGATQFATLKQEVDEKINNVNSRNKVIPTGIPMKFIGVGLSPSNLAIIEALEYSDYSLANVFGVSPVLMKPDSTFSNQRDAIKAMVTDVVMPYLETLEQALNAWLVPPFSALDKVDYYVDFDTTVYPELQPDMKLVKEIYGESPAFTWNEYRAMLNFEASDSPAADKHWVSSSLMPADEAILPDDIDAADYGQT